jgi:hypothetical protein
MNEQNIYDDRYGAKQTNTILCAQHLAILGNMILILQSF